MRRTRWSGSFSGASSQWNNARPGKVAEALIHRDPANPLFVLDEIDKAGGDAGRGIEGRRAA